MGDETKMSATVYARKLRARQAELKAAHKKAVKAHAVAFELWKMALASWLRSSAVTSTVSGLLQKTVYGGGYNRDWRIALMEGAPKAPRRPTDEIQRRIALKLRQLAITGQASAMVTERDIKELFTDVADDEDDL